MKKLWIVGLVSIVTFTMSLDAKTKRYQIESGMVNYTISGGGNVMGLKNEMSGHKTLYFEEYGNIEIQESEDTTKMMGQVTKNSSFMKIENGMVYSVDHESKSIIKQDMSEMMQGKDMTKVGKEMLEQMGGKKIGSGEVLGYDCEIWEAMGSKIWIHKGILLKIESNIMGIKRVEEAKEAKFGVSIPKEKLKLPNYPTQTLQEMMEHKMQDRGTGMGGEMDMPTPEEMKQMQEMMQNMFGNKK